jgi:hypothetical protein
MSEQLPRLKPNDFDEYLQRFDTKVGAIEAGQYGQYKGRLILKMNREQFEKKYNEYISLGIKYGTMLSRSDTIEDTLTVDLKAAEIELLITESLFLPFPKYLD